MLRSVSQRFRQGAGLASLPLLGMVILVLLPAAPGQASSPGNSLHVYPPHNRRESLNVHHPGSFTISVTGWARRSYRLYVFQEDSGGCAGLESELEFAQDAQQLYYRFDVQGGFNKTTAWEAFRDAGRQWACAYLASRSDQVILHRFVRFTVTAPPIGRLGLDLPSHPRAGHRYEITLKGFAARRDSLWMYVAPGKAGRCLSWFAFHDATYGAHHTLYSRFVVRGKFLRTTSWAEALPGSYRACSYLVETSAYPQRILARSAAFRVS
jgi:hypothetical protein